MESVNSERFGGMKKKPGPTGVSVDFGVFVDLFKGSTLSSGQTWFLGFGGNTWVLTLRHNIVGYKDAGSGSLSHPLEDADCGGW